MIEFAAARDGTQIAFERHGSGAPVLLVHGFGSSADQNWKSTGWYLSLAEAGYQAIAMDHRGHGSSGKPHDPAFYDHERMADDVLAVMDAAGVKAAPIIGYSMGGLISLRLALRTPKRLTKLALGGVGSHYLTGPRVSDPDQRTRIADALLTDDKASITDARARMFRDFSEQKGKDRLALAACMRAMSPALPPETLNRIACPVLVVCGEKDDVAGAPGPLAAAFPHGRPVTIAGRDHMSAVGERHTRLAVLDFLKS